MKNLQKKLENNTAAVYRITGDDILVMESACEMIENACGNSMGDLNISRFDNENFSADAVINACEQIPIMADKRFVIVKNITKISESEIKKLIKYNEAPNTDSILVLCEQPAQSVFNKIKCENVVCKKLTEYELEAKINEFLLQFNKKIEKNAAKLLISMCANDLLMIKNELYKLAFCDENSEIITEQNVKALVNIPEEYNIFAITTALSNCDGNKAIRLINKSLENTSFTLLLGLISAFYRRVLYATISNKPAGEVAKILGVQEFAVTKSKQAARNLKPMQMLKINRLILDIDFSIKTGKMGSENAMYYMVFAIIKIIKGEKIE